MTKHNVQYGPEKKVYKGIIFDIIQRQVKFPDDEQTFEFCYRTDSVVILPFDDKGRVLLIKEYRHREDKKMFFLPAGRADIPGEKPLATAKRELREESGFAAKTWKLFHQRFPSTNMIWTTHVYAAKDLRYAPLTGDEHFPIDVVPTPWRKAVKMAKDGTIRSEFISYCILRFDYLQKSGEFKW